MKNRKSNDIMINERGYAMIEVVFAITVIAILASVVLPKIEAAFKTVYVDYEIRNLYGEMRFMQAANRISSFKTNEGWGISAAYRPFMIVTGSNRSSYSLYIGSSTSIRRHYLAPNFRLEQIYNIIANRKGTLSTSLNKDDQKRFKITYNGEVCTPVIIYDTLGRFRITHNDY